MGLMFEEIVVYVMLVVQVDFEEVGDDDVVCKVLGDLIVVVVDIDEVMICQVLIDKIVEVCCQLMEL